MLVEHYLLLFIGAHRPANLEMMLFNCRTRVPSKLNCFSAVLWTVRWIIYEQRLSASDWLVMSLDCLDRFWICSESAPSSSWLSQIKFDTEARPLDGQHSVELRHKDFQMNLNCFNEWMRFVINELPNLNRQMNLRSPSRHILFRDKKKLMNRNIFDF